MLGFENVIGGSFGRLGISIPDLGKFLGWVFSDPLIRNRAIGMLQLIWRMSLDLKPKESSRRSPTVGGHFSYVVVASID